MRRWSLAVLLVSFMGTAAFASNDWKDAVGNWMEADVWSQGDVPTGEEEVKVRGEETICTLNTSTGDWGFPSSHRLRVYEGATLLIEDGAKLLGAGWMRVGAGNPGYVTQTGGLVRVSGGIEGGAKVDSARLAIGDSAGSDGNYTISGGTITYLPSEAKPGGQLHIGARGGTGILTIIGIEPSIQMDTLVVGERTAGASGTIEYQIGALGVSPIGLDSSVTLDPLGDDSTAALIVSLIDTPPAGPILLVETKSDVAVSGLFDTLNGGSAADGAPVTLSYGGTDYLYTLTYAGGVGGNDIVLIPEPATLILFGLGGLIAAARRPRSKK